MAHRGDARSMRRAGADGTRACREESLWSSPTQEVRWIRNPSPSERVPDPRDGPTLRDVFDASYRKLVVQMYGVTGSMDEAEDLVQEAFVRAAAIGRGSGRVENPEAWLRTTAINAHRSRWRKLRNGRRAQDRMLPPSDPQGIDDHLTLIAALRTLPEDQRVAVALHHLADLPVAQVADELGVPIGTVKSRLKRGRDALARQLTPLREGAHHV